MEAVSDNDFTTQVIESDKPVLVDFWAEWCGPCRVLVPHLEELAAEQDKIEIVKLNVDENPETAARYGVLSIPTMILFKDGQEAKRLIGAMPKRRLVESLDSHLS